MVKCQYCKKTISTLKIVLLKTTGETKAYPGGQYVSICPECESILRVHSGLG